MQNGAFELTLIPNSRVSAAETSSGRAHIFRMARIINLRGTSQDWLKLKLSVDERGTAQQKSIRGLGINCQDAAMEQALINALTLPRDTTPGLHHAMLSVYASASPDRPQTETYDLEVLPACMMHKDFAHADLLPAWLSDSASLRTAAGLACADAHPGDAAAMLQAIYHDLENRKLIYMPVPAIVTPDYQQAATMDEVLAHGGYCAELSLLIGSMLYAMGAAPALLLYQDHMAVGCFTRGIPDFETLSDPDAVRMLLADGKLLLTEATGVCTGEHHLSWEAACIQAYATVHRSNKPFVLVNALQLLRSGKVRMLSRDGEQPLSRPAEAPVSEPAQPRRQTVEELMHAQQQADQAAFLQALQANNGTAAKPPVPKPTEPAVPAPEPETEAPPAPMAAPSTPVNGLPPEPAEAAPAPDAAHEAPAAEAPVSARDVRRFLTFGKMNGCQTLIRAAAGLPSAFVLPDRIDGEPLAALGDRAFNHRAVAHAVLPASLQSIGSRCFADCEALRSIDLPDGLTSIGVAAFAGSGLTAIDLPTKIASIPAMAFSGCRSLADAALYDGLTEIGARAFADCPSLKTVTIPATVRRIHRTAFDRDCRVILLGDQTVYVT